jgi:hypothetical protein
MRRTGARYLYLAASTLEHGDALGGIVLALERDSVLRQVYRNDAVAVLELLN